jgi:NADH-quinone oxidoreductase subunit G
MPSLKIDGQTIGFEPGDSIIKAAARQGIEIPHYCWHPGLSAPANCRMCLVEIAPPAGQRPLTLEVLQWDARQGAYKSMQKPKLQPACQMAAVDGMEVKSDTSQHVKEARKVVQESLLLNHPVDCPICDQSGECKLQDYWLEYQKTPKRMLDEPVHKPKAVVFGPTIVYDAERCVMCTRCIRFMDEVAKDHVLDMRERGNLNEITLAPGRQLDGKYTFMTEHVCPVGALTTVDFRFKARVWFLRSVPSICQGCATGCNTHLDYDPRYNRVYRYRPRDNEEVNKYWMCDDGMLSHHRAHQGRVLDVQISGRTVSHPAAMETIKKLFEGVAPESVAVVFSAQHSLEDNWALRELATAGLGTTALFASGLGEGYEDKILIHKDKNPNTRGVQDLVVGARPISELLSEIAAGRVTHAIALGAAAPGVEPKDVATLQSLRALVTLTSHEGPLAEAAQVVLPVTSWAESAGTYVNAKGLRQIAEAAIRPLGSARPAWEQIAKLANAMGFEAGWTRLREIRAKLLVADAVPPPVPSAPEGGSSPAGSVAPTTGGVA